MLSAPNFATNLGLTGRDYTCKFYSEQDPISPLIGKKLGVGVHKKGKIKVGHKGTDYVMFFEDGKYEQEWSGIKSSGTWKLSDDKKTISVKLKDTNDWVVKETSADKMVLTKGDELISLFVK